MSNRQPNLGPSVKLISSVTKRLITGNNGELLQKIEQELGTRVSGNRRHTYSNDPLFMRVFANGKNVSPVADLIRALDQHAHVLAQDHNLNIKKDVQPIHINLLAQYLDDLIENVKKGRPLEISRDFEQAATVQSSPTITFGYSTSAPDRIKETSNPTVTALPTVIPQGRVKDLKITPFEPRNLSSAILYVALSDPKSAYTAAIGPAGSSKTYTSLHWAFNEVAQRRYEKVLLIRPRETTNAESFGAVKGDAGKKMRPYMGALDEHMKAITGMSISELEDRNLLATDTADFIRGKTLSRTIVIVDEPENFATGPLKAISTRPDDSSRMIYTGDISEHQSDIGLTQSGMAYLINRLTHQALKQPEMQDGLSMVEFKAGDSKARNKFLPYLLAAFEEMAEGEVYIPDHAVRSDEISRAKDIEQNRKLAQKNLTTYSEITENKFKAEALKRWPDLLTSLEEPSRENVFPLRAHNIS